MNFSAPFFSRLVLLNVGFHSATFSLNCFGSVITAVHLMPTFSAAACIISFKVCPACKSVLGSVYSVWPHVGFFKKA